MKKKINDKKYTQEEPERKLTSDGRFVTKEEYIANVKKAMAEIIAQDTEEAYEEQATRLANDMIIKCGTCD